MRPVPSGEGMTVRRVRLAERDVVVLGAILNGEDHLASIHGVPDDATTPESDARVIVAVLTTEARAAELDVWLTELAPTLGLELLDA